MKRLFYYLSVIILLIAVIGCSGTSASVSDSSIKPSEEGVSRGHSKEENTFAGNKSTDSPTANTSSTSNLVKEPEQPVKSLSPQSGGTKETEDKPAVRFIVMADSRGSDKGINSEIVKRTFAQIKKLNPQPQFAVMPGDLVGGGKTYAEVKSQLEYFKKTVTGYYPIEFFYPGFGNHEASAGKEGEKAFNDVFKEIKATILEGFNRTVYYFDSGDIRFYMLNSNHPGNSHKVSDSQLNWVKSNIDPSKKYNMFFFHEPAFPTGSHVGSALDSNVLQRNKLWQLIDSTKGSMVFVGHEHNYTRRHIDASFNGKVGDMYFKFAQTVYQVTVGSFGAPLYKEYTSKKNVDVPPVAQYHYAVVDLDANGMRVNVYNLDGQVLDSFRN